MWTQFAAKSSLVEKVLVFFLWILSDMDEISKDRDELRPDEISAGVKLNIYFCGTSTSWNNWINVIIICVNNFN